MKKYDYKISVIIPLYNVEEYVDETFESIENQTMNIKDIQIILVNDGSKDNLEANCLRFKEKYPINVIYVKKENGGVSSARNEGMKYIKGKYVTFLDADDKWSDNAFEYMYNAFEKHPDVAFISSRVWKFEKDNEWHTLDYKFGKSRVVDTTKDYQYLQTLCAPLLFKYEDIKNHKWNEHIRYAEDALYSAGLLATNPKYYVLRESVFLYRVRKDNDNATKKSTYDKSFYFDTPKYVLKYLLENFEGKYFKFYCAYEIYFRLNKMEKSILNKKEKKEYYNIIKYCLNKIDDDIILNHKVINQKYKVKMLQLKNNDYKYNVDEKEIIIKDIKINGNMLNIIGTFYLENKDAKIYMVINKKDKTLVDFTNDERNDRVYTQTFNLFDKKMNITIDVEKVKNMHFEFVINGKTLIAKLKFDIISGLFKNGRSYISSKEYIIRSIKDEIISTKNTYLLFFKRRLALLIWLFKEKKYKSLSIRFMYTLTYYFIPKKQLINKNGEIYIDDKNVKLYSLKYYLYLLHCDEIKEILSDKYYFSKNNYLEKDTVYINNLLNIKNVSTEYQI